MSVTRNRQWTADPNDPHIPPVDKRVCKCGALVGEHWWTEDWRLVAQGCKGFEEKASKSNHPDSGGPDCPCGCCGNTNDCCDEYYAE